MTPGKIARPIKNILKSLVMPWLVSYRQYSLQRKVSEAVVNGQPVRVIVGAGPTKFDDWIATDLPYLNILSEDNWAKMFRLNTIDRILAEHVVEHLTIEQFRNFLRLIRPFLSSTALIRIAVPDGNHPDPYYLDTVRVGGSGCGAGDHKVLYTNALMGNILSSEGYDYRLVEYFDENGVFHQVKWDPSDGMVFRSAEFDPRNKKRALSFTSLIVDCWPSTD